MNIEKIDLTRAYVLVWLGIVNLIANGHLPLSVETIEKSKRKKLTEDCLPDYLWKKITYTNYAANQEREDMDARNRLFDNFHISFNVVKSDHTIIWHLDDSFSVTSDMDRL